MLKKQICCVMLFVVIFILSSAGILLANSASVYVSATVLPYVQMNVTQHETYYSISPRDLEQGYIVIPSSVTVNIDTNTSELILSFLSSGAGQIDGSLSGLSSFGERVEIMLTDNEKHARHASRKIDLRVSLDQDTQIGEHILEPMIMVEAF